MSAYDVLLAMSLAVLAIAWVLKLLTPRRRVQRPLPTPRPDDRNWTGAWMRDVKRWSR